jgi:hypothetical protein
LLSAKQIEPGKTGQLEVTVHTEGITSKVTKTVTVTTNDPRQPQVILTVMATVRSEFTLSENRIFFGNVPTGKEVSKEIVITIVGERPLKLLSAVSTDNNVRVKLQPVPGSGGKSFKLVSIRKSDAKPGHLSGSIVVRTSSIYKPELKIPVSGMIAPSND